MTDRDALREARRPRGVHDVGEVVVADVRFDRARRRRRRGRRRPARPTRRPPSRRPREPTAAPGRAAATRSASEDEVSTTTGSAWPHTVCSSRGVRRVLVGTATAPAMWIAGYDTNHSSPWSASTCNATRSPSRTPEVAQPSGQPVGPRRPLGERHRPVAAEVDVGHLVGPLGRGPAELVDQSGHGPLTRRSRRAGAWCERSPNSSPARAANASTVHCSPPLSTRPTRDHPVIRCTLSPLTTKT